MKWVLAAVSGVCALVCTSAVGASQPASKSVETIAPMVLNGYSRFPHEIGTAPVNDLNDHRVASMQKLLAASDGQPTAIEIWLPKGQTLTVSASNVSYDEQHNIVTVGLTDAELGQDKSSSGR